ncbi:hypothetical protein [Sinomicrobium sp. M5D2P17]
MVVNSKLCFEEVIQNSKANSQFTSNDFTLYQGFIDKLGLNLSENHIANRIVYLNDKYRWRKLLKRKIEELNGFHSNLIKLVALKWAKGQH